MIAFRARAWRPATRKADLADRALRDRLDALYVAGAQAEPAVVIELRRDASRPQRGPGTR